MTVALVLAGGAARGAYEVGVVKYILEEVARDIGRVPPLDVLCGTSVGALNACALAAFADEPRGRAQRLVDVWTGLEVTQLVKPDTDTLLGIGSRLLGRRAGRAPLRQGGVLDPTGLEQLIEASIPFDRIGPNLRDGYLRALTVSTTHVASGKTMVFVQRKTGDLPSWSRDPTIVPRAAIITAKHALASAAVPILFRAVDIEGEWHCDGGLRQNVPLSPARRLAANAVIVINPRYLTTLAEGDAAKEETFPGPLFLLGKTLNALLLDRLDTDLARLESINHVLEAGTRAYGPDFIGKLNQSLGKPEAGGLRPMKSVLVRATEDIGRIAAEYVRSPAFDRVQGITGRLLRRLGDNDAAQEADLLSYVLFDGGFCGRLIELGRADAKAKHTELCKAFD